MLVIIGLIIGGVLVGRDLVDAAATRATLAQIEKYNSAVNTFRTKYNALPGDILNTQAASFGFVTRAGSLGRGNGNGIIEPWCYGCAQSSIAWPVSGEALFFWEDLSSANLIDGVFNYAQDTALVPVSGSSVSLYIPSAKIGNGNYICVYNYNGINYFDILAVNGVYAQSIDANGHIYSNPGLTVTQAYNMDKKIDDGIPVSGHVQAVFPNNTGPNWYGPAPTTTTSGGNSTSCYDTTSNNYSTGQNKGAGVNCGLQFQFQE